MTEIINIVSKIIFIFFIISSILFGFSIAINIVIKNIIKKITKESNENYNKLSNNEKQSCDLIITSFMDKLNEYNNINKNNTQIDNKNKIRKIFKRQPLEKLENPYSIKYLIINLLKSLSIPFFGNDSSYLDFSERELFSVISTLLTRIRKILDASGVIWLKKIKISFILLVFDLYGKYSKFKNNKVMYIILKIISFFSFIYKFLSPVSAFKFLVKNIKNQGFVEMISSTFIEILCKELAVIYKKKSVTNLI